MLNAPFNIIPETDLILNADGSAYHINLLPEDVADTVITVGDQDRVPEITRHFDSIELKKGKREFITHTGYIGKKRLTVISTGIGTDNIDIVLNELDTLVNVDLHTRKPLKRAKSLQIIRIGTSGAIQPDIPVDSLLVSEAAFGLDPLLSYYGQHLNTIEDALLADFTNALPVGLHSHPYLAVANEVMLLRLAHDVTQGITITAPGFYAPQGRITRAHVKFPDLLNTLSEFSSSGKRIANLEMETAGIYGLANSMGHKAISFNIILANRITQQFSKNPSKVMKSYIKMLLERIAA